MLAYRFKVSLDFNKRIYRNIEILENQSLDDLHEMIFTAFDRYEEHLYTFYLTLNATKSFQRRYNAPKFTSPICFDDHFSLGFGEDEYGASETSILSLGLEKKDKLYYLFDFGDSWWHEITLQSIIEVENKKGYPKIVKKVGESPPQYPDYDEDED